MQQLKTFDFNGHALAALDHDAKPVFTCLQVAEALGYADPKNLTEKVHAEWADEFIPGLMTVYVEGEEARSLHGASGGSPTASRFTNRITLLTKEGVYLAAMKSRTPKAKAFRRFVATVVLPAFEQQAQHPAPPDLREMATALATAIRDGLAPLDARLSRLERGVLEPVPPAAPPAGSVTASAIAATYGTTRGKIGACASRLRRTYGQCGVLAVGRTFPPGKATYWYTGIEVRVIADALGLQPVAAGNILTLFGGRS